MRKIPLTLIDKPFWGWNYSDVAYITCLALIKGIKDNLASSQEHCSIPGKDVIELPEHFPNAWLKPRGSRATHGLAGDRVLGV